MANSYTHMAPEERYYIKTKAGTAEALCRITKGLEGIFDTFTSDNGREFSDHALVLKATVTDEQVRRAVSFKTPSEVPLSSSLPSNSVIPGALVNHAYD